MGTEPNHAIIYNLREGIWYNTVFQTPTERSAGIYEQIYRYPIMTSAQPNELGTYSSWQHEIGLDDVSGPGATSKAIKASITTSEKNLIAPTQGIGLDRNMSFNLLEPDFNQIGDLNFIIQSRQNARATQRSSVTKVIPENPTPQEELTKFTHTGRLNAFTIESNTLGGYFEFGIPLVHTVTGDGRRED